VAIVVSNGELVAGLSINPQPGVAVHEWNRISCLPFAVQLFVRVARLHYRTRKSCVVLWMLVSSIPSPLHIVGGAGGPGAAHMNLRRGPNICASGARSKRKAADERSGSPMPEDRTRGNRASGRGRLLGIGSETKRRRMGWPNQKA
jgi:hypothetical protein